MWYSGRFVGQPCRLRSIGIGIAIIKSIFLPYMDLKTLFEFLGPFLPSGVLSALLSMLGCPYRVSSTDATVSKTA